MSDEKKKYQLYAMTLSEETVRIAEKSRFNRVTAKYVLVYSDSLCCDAENSRYHIIDQNEIAYLNEEEQRWLLECNLIIIAEESKKNAGDVLKLFETKLKRLEEELEKESENMEIGNQ